ncbi:hypothetical protein [Chryseobacterium pennipullorum]|uniref:hypothetical protein n=1 Tax=Chryseobacterium pennipullorum TaxID=2258963 RepID=UPI0014023EDF|nr:hypothetical protein [Chryseobacterium pennipullorum]
MRHFIQLCFIQNDKEAVDLLFISLIEQIWQMIEAKKTAKSTRDCLDSTLIF